MAAARGYPHHAHDAGDHVRRAPPGAQGAGRQTGADRWRGGHGGLHRQGRRNGGVRSRPLRHAAAVQESRQSGNPRGTTGPEIWDDTDGAIDVLVSGIGTGGTITGVSRYIKQEKGKKILSVGVEPTSSPVITQKLAGQPLRPGPHKIQGIGAGFIPDTLDLSMVDRVELVTNEESIEMARRLAKEEGILSGISCGAAAAVAVRLGKQTGVCGKDHRCRAAGCRRALSEHGTV